MDLSHQIKKQHLVFQNLLIPVGFFQAIGVAALMFDAEPAKRASFNLYSLVITTLKLLLITVDLYKEVLRVFIKPRYEK